MCTDTQWGHYSPSTLDTVIFMSPTAPPHQMGDVIQLCELIEADGQVAERCQTRDLFQFTQTVTVEIQHLDRDGCWSDAIEWNVGDFLEDGGCDAHELG